MNIYDVKMARVRLSHVSAPIADIPGKVMHELRDLQVKKGARIAVACGSRGISNISLIAASVVKCLIEKGAEPFIIPAMGSHGGATGAGQAQVLADYGITEETMGVKVISQMDTVRIGSTGGDPDIPVYMDKNAWESDGVIVINRVKPHTDFHGTHESGIVKMLTIGLGKQRQAETTHFYGADGLRDQIPRISQRVIDSGKIIGAVAILEDGYDNTSDICYAPADKIFEVDSQFIERSRRMMARLPFDDIDVLIVDRQGKNYSGTGMDTNVIGRLRIPGQEDGTPRCSRIAVLDLSDESHGNALGVGLADVTTKRFYDKIDWHATNENVITSGFLQRGFLPIVAQSDISAISIALNSCGARDAKSARVVRIRSTLELEEILVSEALIASLPNDSTVLSAPEKLDFNKDGNLF